MRIDDEMIDRFLTSLTASEKSRSTYRVGVRVLGKSRLIKTTLRANGFDSDRLTAHSLRHTAVTLALQSGCEFAEVQQFAHHQWANSTAIYYHHKRYNDDNTECPNAVDKLIKAR